MTDNDTATDADTPVVSPNAPPRFTADYVLWQFRARRDGAALTGASAQYRDGLTRGWATAISIAEQIAARTRPSEVHALIKLRDAIVENKARITGTAGSSGPSPLLPEVRQGREDAYAAAFRVSADELVAAKQRIEEQEEQRDRDRREASERESDPGEDDLSSWDAYPLVPMGGDEQVRDLADLALFLGGDGTSFTGDLLRLIGKADPSNLNQLAAGFPRHVRAFLIWRACAPIPVRSLVALLNATTMITDRRL